jgi:hypothetical protein
MKLAQVQLMLGVSILAGIIGVSSGNAAEQSAMERGTMLKNICVQTLGVSRSAIDLDACTSSLSDSLTLNMQIAHDIDVERHCSTSGTLPGTAGFDKCEIAGEAANPPAKPAMETIVVFAMPHLSMFDSDPSSYYDLPFQTKRQKEEEACAQIGVEIGECVASLDAALFVADNPNI